MKSMDEALREIVKQSPPCCTAKTTYNEWLKDRAERANEENGSLDGEECPVCNNKGYSLTVVDGELRMRECECIKARKALERIKKSGLGSLLEAYTFEKYVATEEWQKSLVATAQEYLANGDGKWMFFGGMAGSGKSHLCTAVCGELLKRKKDVRYMMWDGESKRLKALANSPDYQDEVDEVKRVDILYIDDFLKTQTGQKPSHADILLAFEILNYRYVNKLRTIISSERNADEIIDLDGALGSRLYEMSKGYQANIGRDPKKNYRLRKEKV